MSSALQKPLGDMSLAELRRLIDQRIAAQVPPIPAQVQRLADLDIPLIAPDVPTDDTVLKYDGTRVTATKVTAAVLEAVMVLATTIVAGDPNAARIELGLDQDDPGQEGIRAFDASSNQTFNIDAQDGSVYAKGRIDFGTGSRLLANDIVEIPSQASSGFQTPARAQKANAANFNPSVDIGSINCTWVSPTTSGSLLLAVVSQENSGGGSTPSSPTISGWTLVQTATIGSGPIMRQSIFKIENAASRSGAESVNLGSATRHAAVQLFEYSGTGVQDVLTTANTGVSTAPGSNNTGTLAQAGELLFGAITSDGDAAFSLTNSFTDAGNAQSQHTTGSHPIVTVADTSQVAAEKVVTATTSTGVGATLSSSRMWIAQLVTFKAKAAGTSPDTPDTGKLRLYVADDGAGTPTPHTINDAGTANSLAMAPVGAGWRLDYATASISWPTTAAHTAAANQNVTISGLNVGDLCFIIGRGATGGMFITYTDPVCATSNTIVVKGFNADTASQSTTSQTYHFLIIHKT